MGFFSWNTSDTKKSVANAYSCMPVRPVKMIDDKGNSWCEPAYEGYGDFGGMDYYALMDQMNGGTGDRDRGISLEFSGDPVKRPKIVELDCVTPWDQLPDSESCEFQGYFYE